MRVEMDETEYSQMLKLIEVLREKVKQQDITLEKYREIEND